MISKPLRFALLTCSMVALLAGSAAASSFEDALTAAYQTNPRIKSERQKLEGTDEGVAQAVSGFRPTVTANYNPSRQRTSFGGAPDVEGNGTTKSLTVSQPIFRGGGTWSSWQAASQRVKSGQYELSAVEQQVMLNAVTAYMNVVANSAILDLSRKNMGVLDEQLKAATTRFEVGEVTRTDVAQSEARLSAAKTGVIAAEGQLLSSIAAYERTMGGKPEGTLTVPDKLPELPVTLDEALERARGANPQLLAALHNARASEYDVRTNQAQLLPRVSLVGSLSRQDGAGANGSTKFEQDSIGLQVAIPLYQSGAEYSRVREAEAISRQRKHETIDQRMTNDEAVTQNWEQLESAIATIVSRNDQIKASALALDGVKQEQQYGSRTVLDVLDAEQELFTARTNLVRAQRDRIVAAYSLAFTLGQLTPTNLGLQVAQYDPQVHADDVEWKSIGF
ncbi:MAG: TolC family outer membrane protein [Pseudomonadota bacterium]